MFVKAWAGRAQAIEDTGGVLVNPGAGGEGAGEERGRKRVLGEACVGRKVGAWDSSPMLERAEERSMMVLLPGLLSTDRFARERSAVTRVMEILGQGWRIPAHF